MKIVKKDYWDRVKQPAIYSYWRNIPKSKRIPIVLDLQRMRQLFNACSPKPKIPKIKDFI